MIGLPIRKYLAPDTKSIFNKTLLTLFINVVTEPRSFRALPMKFEFRFLLSEPRKTQQIDLIVYTGYEVFYNYISTGMKTHNSVNNLPNT